MWCTLEEDGSFTYTPDAGFFGTDTFTYRANDGTSPSAATTVTITVEEEVAAPNTAPVAVDDAFSTVAGEPLSLAAPGVLGNDTDADGDALTATRTSQPVNGSVTLAADGSFTYTPDAGSRARTGSPTRAGDGTDTSAPATVTITVKPAGGTGGPGGPGGGDGLLTSAVAGASAAFTYGKVGLGRRRRSPRQQPPARSSWSTTAEVLAAAAIASGQATAGARRRRACCPARTSSPSATSATAPTRRRPRRWRSSSTRSSRG